MRRGGRLWATFAAVALAFPLAACSSGADDPAEQAVVNVPADATLAEAGSLVADGGVILIGEGTYHGTLAVAADNVTVRGADRNAVILDGQLKASNGVVATGKNVAVENLTVRNYLQNGVLVTGVTDDDGNGIARGPDGYTPDSAPPPVAGYLIRYVTASNNGLYGIYAFNRSQGVIENNLATGSADSGIYVGQCEACNVIVRNNVTKWNAVGLEFANASGPLAITTNRIVDNRVGITVVSNHLEAHSPATGAEIAGNLIAENNAKPTPVQAEGGFGVGIGLSGTKDVLVHGNSITDNKNVGIWLTSSTDLAPQGNKVGPNRMTANGTDIAYVAAEHTKGKSNCFDLGANSSTNPAALKKLQPGTCDSATPSGDYQQPSDPEGVPFSQVKLPGDAAGLKTVNTDPTQVPNTVDIPDLSKVKAPNADLLKDGQ